MHDTMKNRIVLSLVLVLVLVVIFTGCGGEKATSEINYLTYEIKPNDIRFNWTNLPLFSFEYPEKYRLYDLNDVTELVITYNHSTVDFKDETSVFPQYLTININKPWAGYYDNANDYLNDRISHPEWFPGSITTSKVAVAGVEADYVESDQNPNLSGMQEKYRLVIFDYAGMIWEIFMSTYSIYPEPAEIQESFEHILNTFKFIEIDHESIHPSSELNISINYDYEKRVFTIINNEDSMLCELKLYLNYTDDELTTGFQTYQVTGIRSHETRYVKYNEFRDTYGNYWGKYGPAVTPSKLLVQAEFPGCVGKVYTYLKIWE